MTTTLILSFSAPDRPGIVAGVSSAVAALGCDIRDAQVHGDGDTGLFFVRLVLASPLAASEVQAALMPVVWSMRMSSGASWA